MGPSTVRTNSSIHIKKRFIKIVNKNFKGNVLTLTEKGYNILKKILPIWKKFNIEGKKLYRIKSNDVNIKYGQTQENN